MLISVIKDWQGLQKTQPISILFLFAFLMEFTNIRAEDGLTIQNVYYTLGEPVAVAVNLNNEQSYTAFQLDIKLPEGISVVQTEGSKGFALTTRASASHLLSSSTLSDGTIRVVVFSSQNEVFSGNTGDLIQFFLTINEDFKESEKIEIKNILFTSTTIQEVHFKDVSVPCSENLPPQKGDVNNDGNVNVIDVVTVIDYILMKNPAVFVFTAADVNSDQQVNVIDVVGIIDIILGKWMPAPMRRSVTDGTQDKLLLVKNDDQSLSLCLENQGQYVAAQFDLKLQSGQTLMNIRANEDRAPNHQLSYSEIEPGVYRVLLIGMDNSPLEGQHGEIVNFKIAGGVNGAMIENAQFVTANRKAVNFGTISDITTGIMDIKSARLMDIYSTDGRLLRGRTTTTEGLNKGLYIINNKKIIVE